MLLLQWFRHYVDACFDPKFRTIAKRADQSIERVVFVWWALCEQAVGHNGVVPAWDGEVISDHLDCNSSDIRDVCDAMCDVGLIRLDAPLFEGFTLSYVILNWEKRQRLTVSGADRTKAWRERKNVETKGECDAHVTRDAIEQTRTEQKRTDSISLSDKGTELSKKHNSIPYRCVEIWNDTCVPPLQRVQRLTGKRETAVRRTLKEIGGIEAWTALCQLIPERPFLCGQNDRGWKADFDWMCGSGKAVRVLEGGYQSQPRNGNGRHENFQDAAVRDLIDACEDREQAARELSADPGSWEDDLPRLRRGN